MTTVDETRSAEAVAALETLVQYDHVSLVMDPAMTYEEWERTGQNLTTIEGAIQWWRGDWWRFGERQWGEAASAAAPTGKSVKTLQNAAWVAEKFADPSRRREELGFDEHAAVAGLPSDRADRILDRAVEEGLSTRDVRKLARDVRAEIRGVRPWRAATVCVTCGEIGPVADVFEGMADIDRYALGKFMAAPPDGHRGHDLVWQEQVEQ